MATPILAWFFCIDVSWEINYNPIPSPSFNCPSSRFSFQTLKSDCGKPLWEAPSKTRHESYPISIIYGPGFRDHLLGGLGWWIILIQANGSSERQFACRKWSGGGVFKANDQNERLKDFIVIDDDRGLCQWRKTVAKSLCKIFRSLNKRRDKVYFKSGNIRINQEWSLIILIHANGSSVNQFACRKGSIAAKQGPMGPTFLKPF